jgi:enolase-phosphatase E1
MIEVSGIKAILTDIEGTTSSLSFVKDVLFPYAREHIPNYVRTHETEITKILEQVREIENNPSLTIEAIISLFIKWIDEDKKITPLKTLQGLVWNSGFKLGAFKGHVYDDAADVLQLWFNNGLDIYIYSSGSIAAQKLLYGHSERGDLTTILSGYFDTTTGPKLEAASYKKIAGEIGLPPSQVLFLSDHFGEIDAAKEAGYKTIALDRDHQHSGNAKYAIAHTFNDIQIRERAA